MDRDKVGVIVPEKNRQNKEEGKKMAEWISRVVVPDFLNI